MSKLLLPDAPVPVEFDISVFAIHSTLELHCSYIPLVPLIEDHQQLGKSPNAVRLTLRRYSVNNILLCGFPRQISEAKVPLIRKVMGIVSSLCAG